MALTPTPYYLSVFEDKSRYGERCDTQIFYNSLVSLISAILFIRYVLTAIPPVSRVDDVVRSAQVSPYMKFGHVKGYLKDHHPGVNRVLLLSEIASGTFLTMYTPHCALTVY